MKNHDFQCPITGGKLVVADTQPWMHTLDGPTTYNVDGHPNIVWEDWPRSGNMWIAEVRGEETRYFEQENNELKELVRIGDSYFDKPTTLEEQEKVDKLTQEYNQERREKQDEYERLVKEGKVVDTRIYAKTIPNEKIEVRPMSAPSNDLFYMNTSIAPKNE